MGECVFHGKQKKGHSEGSEQKYKRFVHLSLNFSYHFFLDQPIKWSKVVAGCIFLFINLESKI